MRSLLVLVVAMPAMAASMLVQGADWDHDANIESAVSELVTAYRQDGMAGIEKLVASCYAVMDTAEEADAQLRQLETCASMDFAAYRVDRSRAATEGRAITAYFSAELIMGRMGRLSKFLETPTVENQVLRAWSRAATDALERAGPL